MLRITPRSLRRILTSLVAALAAACHEHFPQPIAAEMPDAAFADDAMDELSPLDASMNDETDAMGSDIADEAWDDASDADVPSDL